ncbi:hypothetical protein METBISCDRAFT_19170, partial [Metschnikowia bicuspidata]
SALASAVLAEEPSTLTVVFSGSTDTHVYGKFHKTQAESSAAETGTHRWGRFDKTSAESSDSETGTHRWGRFDKTSAAETSSETGTHRWGRFDKTKQPVTTTLFLDATSADIYGTNSSVSSSFKAGAASLSGLSVGLAGAFAVGVFLL